MPVFWPQTLPLPTVEGYAVQPGDAILRTEMEAGLARQRRRFTDVPSVIAVRWVMTRNQFAVFEAWFKLYAKEGAEFFDIDLLGGIGITTHSARFTRQFDARLFNGNLWEVTSQLEIRERPTLDLEATEILLENPPEALLATVDDLHRLIHEKMPGPLSW
jgi:hypothetical protein